MRSSKYLLVLFFLPLGFISGIARQLLAPGQLISAVDIPAMLLGLFLVFAWYRIDSDQRGYRRSPLLNIAVIALTLLALPYYFFRSRGLLWGFVATVLFLVFGFAYSVLQWGGEYAAYATWQS